MRQIKEPGNDAAVAGRQRPSPPAECCGVLEGPA